MDSPADVVLLPDAGPLITLAYANALDHLFMPGWTVGLVDVVLHEVTRNQTPTSEKLAQWAKDKKIPVLPTKIFQRFQQTPSRQPHLGELAIQEAMNEFALREPPTTGVFLFEDHKIARATFLVPSNCRKISTRAFLIYLERKGWIDSAAEVERSAIQAGRAFSQLRFPPE